MLLCYKWLNSLWRAVGFHGVPVHQVRSEGMDEGTERLAVAPGARHVGDGDPRVGAQHQPAPLLQRPAAWHPHGVWCHWSEDLKSCSRGWSSVYLAHTDLEMRWLLCPLSQWEARHIDMIQSEARQRPRLYLRSFPEAEYRHINCILFICDNLCWLSQWQCPPVIVSEGRSRV